MSGVRFEDPPTGSAVHDRCAAELRVRPGEWAITDLTAGKTDWAMRVTAFRIRRGWLRAFRPAGTYDAAFRTVDGELRLYARYVGNGDEGAA